MRFYQQRIKNKEINTTFKLNNPDVKLPPDYLIYESFQLNYHKYYFESKITAENLVAQRQEPLGISIGTGIPVGKGKLHLNLDYVNGLLIYDRLIIPNIEIGNSTSTEVLSKEERRDIVNFGAGIEIYINERFKSFASFTTDYNAFISNANIFDLSTEDSIEINIGENFIHYSVGIDLKLNFASVILGTTYTNSTAKFVNPIDLNQNTTDINNQLAEIKYTRWQVVVGLEIPVFEKTLP
jgi:hypothetical protein